MSSEQQQQVIESNSKRLAVLAAAGSGKSTTMSRKVKRYLDEGVSPRNIAVITFTKDATESVTKKLEDYGCDTDALTVKTLHSFCYQLMKICYQFTARPKLPTIMSSHNVFLGHFWKLTSVYRNMPHKSWSMYYETIYHYQMARLLPETVILETYNCTPDQFRKQFLVENPPNESFASKYHQSARDAYSLLIYLEYESWKKLNKRMDFNDMLLMALRELEKADENVIRFIKNKYKVIIVDEMQDTNALVVDVLKLVTDQESDVIMIGDIRQSVYSFINASPGTILEYINNENFDFLSLNTNFRSHAEIVDNSNFFISHYPEVCLGGDAVAHLPENNFPVTSLISTDEMEEVDTVASKIDDLTVQGYKYSDIAILYRTNAQAMLLLDWCIGNNIPFNIKVDSDTIFDKSEMKDIIAYLKIFNETDKTKYEDFKRIMNKPVRYLSNTALDSASNIGMGVAGFGSDLFNRRHRDSKLQEFAENLAYHVKISKNKTLAEQIEYIMVNIGYEKWWESSDDKDKFFDLRLYTNSLAKLAETHHTYRDLIKHIKHVRRTIKEQPNSEEGINFYTIHASKGLEFPVCFVLGICDRLYPFHRAVNENGNEGIQEEARLFYVASTRPIERLYYSEVTHKMGKFKVNTSPFAMQTHRQIMNGEY